MLIACAIASGVLQALLPVLPGQSVVALLVLIPLLRALDGASARGTVLAAIVYAFALGEVAIVPWLGPALAAYFALTALRATLLAVGIVAILALGHGVVLGVLLTLRPRACGAWRVLWLAALWTVWEALRSYAPPLVPAALLGVSLDRSAVLLQLASVTGIGGVTAVVVAANAGLASLLERRAPRTARLRAALTGVALVALAALWGANRLRAPVATPPDAPVVVAVDVVAHDASQSTLERLLAATPLADGRRRDLVVWPESALNSDLDRDRATFRRLTEMVAERGVTLVTGGVTLALEPDGRTTHRFNALHVIRPRFAIESYHKRLLVPLAEAWPSFLGEPPATLEPVSAGSDLPVLRSGTTRFGPSICFEIADAASVRDLARNGASFVINVTNDVWFQGTSAPHLDWARVRAIESGLPVVRVANAGTSVLFDALGRAVASSTRETSPGVLEVAVPAPRATAYVATGELFVPACLLIVVIGAITSARVRSRRAAVAEAVLGRVL